MGTLIMSYHAFAIYGFGTVCPEGWRVELNPKSDQSAGDVAFKSADKYNILLSWGPIDRVRAKLGTPELHAAYSVQKIRDRAGANTVEELQKSTVRVGGHMSAYSHMRITIKRPRGFRRAPDEVNEMRSYHIHCPNTNRYFMLYGTVKEDRAGEQGDVLKRMSEKFTCHGNLSDQIPSQVSGSSLG